MVYITVPRGKFAKEELENLTAQLTDLVIKWEGGTEAPGYDKASWALVQEADLVAVGGRPRSAARPSARCRESHRIDQR